MATRLCSLGFELGLVECNYWLPVGTAPTISATKTRTGSSSLRYTTGQHAPYGRWIGNTTELRAFYALNHAGLEIGSAAVDRHVYLFYLLRADGTSWRIGWHAHNATVGIYNNSTTATTTAIDTTGSLPTQDTWHQISCAAKIHNSAGWIDLYVNGLLAVSLTGNTGTSPIVAVLIGGSVSNNGEWNAFAYFDDFYVDDTTSEASAASTEKRFLYLAANGNGELSQFTGSDGNSTDNYLLVDDSATNDGDTTYVGASANGLIDSYTHATLTTPINYTPTALIPTVFAKKTDAIVDTEYQARLHKGSDNSTGTAKDLSTSYAMYQDRFTALPDASPLGDANINSTEVGIIAAGTY